MNDAQRDTPHYQPPHPSAQSTAQKSKLEYWGANNMLFRGRLDRTSFAAAMILTYILLAVTGYLVALAVALLQIIIDDRAYFIFIPFLVFCLGLFSIAGVLHFSAIARRLHDFEKPASSWWLYYGALLASVPGTKGPNRYGDTGRHLRILELLSLGIEKRSNVDNTPPALRRPSL